MDDSRFGQLVRTRRERLLLTQEQLAERADLSVRALRAIESGEVRSPRAHTVALLAGALELAGPEREAFTGSLARTQGAPRPALLPPDIGDFTGRHEAVAALMALLGVAAPSAVAVAAVAGRAGVGKTTLAIHVAHRLRPRFPDGQLYVNLRGAHAHRLDPSDVLARFLRALGREGAAIPSGLEERAELYRGLLADREVLVVLDDAAGEAQVRALLPGSPSCAVLLTSRARLASLEGAHLVELDVLDRAQAVGLLGSIAGDRRVRAEPRSAAAIVAWCGALPLAVRVAGAKLAARPHWSLAHLEELLADERWRLDQLTAGDLEVRASVALSYEALADEERTAWRRLALLHAPDVAAWVVAALLDVAPGRGDEVVERLVQAQLLDAAGHGPDGQPRYRFHDLLRVYARERAREEEPAQLRHEALSRAFGAWLALAERADQALPNGSSVVCRGGAARWRLDAGREATLLADPIAWMEAERLALVSAVEQACAGEAPGMDELAWDLAQSLASFFEVRSYFDEWRSTNARVLALTRRTGNRRGQLVALRSLAESQLEHDRLDDAAQLLEEALRLARTLGDDHELAYTLFKLASAERYRGRALVALHHATCAVEMFERLEDCLRLGYALYERGTAHLQLEGHEEALADLTAALWFVRDDQRASAQVHRRLAMVHLEREELEPAARHLTRCLETCRQLRDTLGQAYALENLGRVRTKQGDYLRAGALLRMSHQLFERVGVLRGQGLTLRTMGELHAAQGRMAAAVRDLRRSRDIWRHLDVRTELDRTDRLLDALRGDDSSGAVRGCAAG